MAGIPSSPAVVFLEKDNSAYPANIDSSIVGIVGYASKGPENEPTLITSQENLLRVFGKPSETLPGQGLEGGLEILETTNQIRFVRAVPADASSASASVAFGVCPAIQFNTSSFGVNTNLYLNVTVKDSVGVTVLDNKVLSIPAGTQAAGVGQASAIASKVGDGSVATDHIFVSFDSTTTGTGFLASVYPGIYSELHVSAFSSTTFDSSNSHTSGLFPINAVGAVSAGATSSVSTSGYNISGTGASSMSYRVTALYKGSGYNLSSDAVTGQTLGVSVETDTAGGAKTFLTVNNEGVAAETYKVSLLRDTTFVESVINVGSDNAISEYVQGELYFGSTSIGTANKLEYPHSRLDGLSTEFSAGVAVVNAAATITASAMPRFVKMLENTLSLSGGKDGTSENSTYAAAIGNPADKTGIYALDDDLLNISIALVPGITDQDVQNTLITLAETSNNFIAAVSPPLALGEVEDAVDWMNGKGVARTAAINSSWVSVFWPWVQAFDVFAAKDRWYDPAIFAVRQMAFTDNVAEPWFAPAGFRRGRLTKPTATETALNQGDRDALYTSNINPIVNFNPEGITIFGQKTAQRAATALDRINVRRLMIYLRKVLLQAGRVQLFEPNDEFTWDAIRESANSVLSDIQNRRGITDYQVVCDATVNTPLRVDRNELWCKILLKPTKTAEWIIFEVNLTNQSAKFSG
jgi:phage tail sheath protein FI